MSDKNTASIPELRTSFRRVKKKIEEPDRLVARNLPIATAGGFAFATTASPTKFTIEFYR
jgi:hypothetical protein